MQSEFGLDRPRRYEMGARETGKKIVQRRFVSNVHHRYFHADRVLVSFPDAVCSQGDVEKVSRHNAGWIRVSVVCSGRNNVNQSCAILRRATCPEWLADGGINI